MSFLTHSEQYKQDFPDTQKQSIDHGSFWDISNLIYGTIVVTYWFAQ